MSKLLGGVALLLVLAGGGAAAVTASSSGEALAGTTVAGQDVGGLDRAAVRSRVEALAASRASGELAVTAADVKGTVPRLLAEVDVDATVDAALTSGSVVDRLLGTFTDTGERLEPQLTVDRAALDARLAALAAQTDRTASPGGFVVKGLQVTGAPPIEGRTLEQGAAADLVETALRTAAPGPVDLPVTTIAPATTQAQVDAVVTQARTALAESYVLGEGETTLALRPQDLAPLLSSGPDLDLRLDPAGLRTVVERRAARFEKGATSADFVVVGTGPTVDAKGDLSWAPMPAQVSVTPGATGQAVDLDVATTTLTALVLGPAGGRTGPLPLVTVEPELTTEAAQTAGVTSLIGAFTTYFQAGQPRATNIQRIAQLVDGAYVAPGEVLSLNGEAGRRTLQRGFVADGAIVDGELTDEVGGGVSQFATTLFNAAFFAGLPILEHKPHSFYISRYPAGRESTVYFGSIDVKVRNDTAHGMYVKTRSTAGSVTVEIYGDNGGRRVTSTAGPRRQRDDGGFRIAVTRTVAGGDGKGSRRVFTTSYDPVPPDKRPGR